MTNIRKKDDVLTLLVHLGYLAYDSSQEKVYIPNEEVKKEFLRAVSTSRHKEMVKLIQDSERLLEQTLNMDENAVASTIEEIHKEIGVPLNYNSEDSLRSTVRCGYIACDEEFIRDEELPAGHGYADIVYRPKKGVSRPAILIELKWNKTAAAAIQQIRDKDYPNALRNYGEISCLLGLTTMKGQSGIYAGLKKL